MAEARRCLRPTSRGALCQRTLEWYEVACTNHATDDELELEFQRLRADAHRPAPGWVEVPLPLEVGTPGWAAECAEFGCAESSRSHGPMTPMPSIFRSQSPGGDG